MPESEHLSSSNALQSGYLSYLESCMDWRTHEIFNQIPEHSNYNLLAPSRPGEFHPEPLTEPDLILSHHPARAIARRLSTSSCYKHDRSKRGRHWPRKFDGR